MPTTANAQIESSPLDLRGSSTDLERLRVVLPRLVRCIRASLNDNERISPSQLSVLGVVGRFGPLSVSRIAEIEHVQPPSVSRILGSLEQAGLIERRADPGDRRCAIVVATSAGKSVIAEIGAAGRGWLSQQLAVVDDADVAAIAAAVPALERLMAAQAAGVANAVAAPFESRDHPEPMTSWNAERT